jgi:hypothetical protein
MWSTKCFVTPIIIGATGIVTKDLNMSVNNTRKAFSGFSRIKSSCARDIARNKESATI